MRRPLTGDAIEAPDPIVVVEVISPSSRGVDAGVKLARYFSLASVRHYLIVDTEKRIVIHHLRSEDGTLKHPGSADGLLTLDPPGLAIEIGHVYRS